MCTALSLTTRDHYFGRNLDLDRSYGEEICVMPRAFPLAFRAMGSLPAHYAMIGMAIVVDGMPLYYDATNECGLSMAGLNFPGNAYYAPAAEGKDNVAPFEFIPWILAQCRSVAEAKVLLSRIRLADIAFNEQIPPAPLHWMISDRAEDIVVEATRDGLHIYHDPVGVLTNNPPFEHHLSHLQNYRHLRRDNAEVPRETGLPYDSYCQGLGAVGLPGDVSSQSRFVRAAFGRENSVCADTEEASVSQFFHLLSSVEMVRGVCRTDAGPFDITVYSACINTDRGLYYVTTYDHRRICCADLRGTDLDADTISRFPLPARESILRLN